jgi:1-acyl-sn-glycerol-3-phosphate acyltransferase
VSDRETHEDGVLAGALADLQREVRGRLEEGSEALSSSVSSEELFELFDRLRRIAGTFGMEERSGEVDEFGFDPVVGDRTRPLFEFLATRWWRISVHGLETVPRDQPVLFVANRSGVLPWDGLMVAHEVERWHPNGLRPRFLVADWLITLPFAQSRLARLGGIRACRENAERLLRTGHSVVAFPEGEKGAAKLFADRYRLQRFGRGGVVRLAIACGVPLVPVSIVGGEEAHPILMKLETLARTLGLPFVPVTPTFPWLGPLGVLPLPSRWVLRFGEPLPIGDLDTDAAHDEILISRTTEDLRQRIQTMLDADRRARSGVFS